MNRVFMKSDLIDALRMIIAHRPECEWLGAITIVALVLGLTVEQARKMAREELRGYNEN